MRTSGDVAFVAVLALALTACASPETAFAVPPDCQNAGTPPPGETPWAVPSGRVMSHDCMQRIENSRGQAKPR